MSAADNVFARPVDAYMTTHLETASLDTTVEVLARTLHARGVSSLPILDDAGHLAGIVTRTNLIALGALQAGRRGASPAMPMPNRRARDIMVTDVVSVTSHTSMRVAARLMATKHFHRVYVVDDGTLVGVFSAVDVARAMRDARSEQTLASIMTKPIATIDVHMPLSAAIDDLERLHVTGLIVTADCLPVGMFTQDDALASRDLPRSTPVEEVYDAAVICLPAETQLHRAAAHIAQIAVRRVVACRGAEAVGIVTSFDLVKYVAH